MLWCDLALTFDFFTVVLTLEILPGYISVTNIYEVETWFRAFALLVICVFLNMLKRWEFVDRSYSMCNACYFSCV